MEDLWFKSHIYLLNSKVGDNYNNGTDVISVIKRTPRRIYLSSGDIVHVVKRDFGFFLSGKRINDILRDIEGYFIYQIHSNENI